MLLNAETVLVGSRSSVLVPYRKEHVEQYHVWMQDPGILEATGSEPLSLQEEYDMQKSWKMDEDKCTFIVLDKDKVDLSQSSDPEFVTRHLAAMVGDVNLFFSEEEEVEDEKQLQHDTAHEGTKYQQAEIDIMVAETEARRKGIGKEACCLMMLFAVKKLEIRRFFCKINEDNAASIQLFEKLGFVQCNYAACFKQVEMELKGDKPNDVEKILKEHLEDEELDSFQCPC